MSWTPGVLPGKGKRRGGGITFWVGIGLAVISLAVAIFAWLVLVNGGRDIVDQAEPINGEATVTLQEGDRRTLYQVVEGEDKTSCSVTDPDGQSMELMRSQDVNATKGETSYTSIGAIIAPTTGDYHVVCEGPRAFIGPTPNLGGFLGSLAVMVVAIGGIFAGGLTALIGAIVWFVGRGESKRALEAGYGQGGYGQGGGYGPPGYGQGGSGQGSGYGPPPPPPPSQQ